MLVHFDTAKPIIIKTDTSNYVCAAILSQPGEKGEVRPVAYRSKTMTKTEVNYDVHDKESLEIVQALVDWRRYVSNSEHCIRILTDHQNLIPFTTTKRLIGRQICWSEELSQYNIKIQYRPGKEGGKLDALTRREGDLYKNNDERIRQRERILLPKEQYFEAMEMVEFQDKDKEGIKKASHQDEKIQNIREALETREKEMKGVALRLCVWKEGCLYYQGKI